MDPGSGRGRGGAAKIARIEAEDDDEFQGSPSRQPLEPLRSALIQGRREESGDDDERPRRGRGGYRGSAELVTIPESCSSVRAQIEKTSKPVEVYSNYVRIIPMKEKEILQYRLEIDPQIEASSLRRMILAKAFGETLVSGYTFDGVSDLRSATKTNDKVTVVKVPHPNNDEIELTCTLKEVGKVNWNSFEMMRLYNMHTKDILRQLGYYQISSIGGGAYVNPEVMLPVGSSGDLGMIRGYKTAVTAHDNDYILMNLESCHKLMQQKHVLQMMYAIKSRGGNFREALRAELVGKLVVTSYVKRVYKIEDLNFDMNPLTKFRDDKREKDVSYADYYKERYGITINDEKQPLILATPSNKRKIRGKDAEIQEKDIYLVPELCNIAGLTEQQKTDNRLRVDLIRCSQVPPKERVEQLKDFLFRVHQRKGCVDKLQKWGYSYEQEPVKVKARVLALESIGIGSVAEQNPDRWAKVDNAASFDNAILRDSLAKSPEFGKMAILVPRPLASQQDDILNKLRQGFQKIKLAPNSVEIVKMTQGDSPFNYVQYLKNLPPDVTVALVLLPAQNKEKYDAVKKVAACERGLVTQVVTGRLMTDQRKASGAAIKIGIQMAAKIGGEPWYANIPLKGAMVCGYDTYHDTANRGRSFGAFVASMNDRYSRWFSKADLHDRLEELTSHLTENLVISVRKYQELNKKLPDRVFIYRDGVSDGELEHVFKIEVDQLKRSLSQFESRIKLTMIVVNKRVGARFYLKQGDTYNNCPPGTVIDDVVTRAGRFDFYLISQSTRAGTVSPTYYNIVHDESGLQVNHHQAMAYKFCFLYYNWTGSVRVPAPCQYAHKLAFLCGEHLHSVPNNSLDDRLHFL